MKISDYGVSNMLESQRVGEIVNIYYVNQCLTFFESVTYSGIVRKRTRKDRTELFKI